ncbi:unnamed protein product [Paramecium primaurelia]|uniref:Transmembrane protein n=1 Tax=Paramecium primaurelia TaxID=5886 RepID=A0A8S1NPM7_PARPR|nr:unnamed protein product [Paramecium primaurelia]
MWEQSNKKQNFYCLCQTGHHKIFQSCFTNKKRKILQPGIKIISRNKISYFIMKINTFRIYNQLRQKYTVNRQEILSNIFIAQFLLGIIIYILKIFLSIYKTLKKVICNVLQRIHFKWRRLLFSQNKPTGTINRKIRQLRHLYFHQQIQILCQKICTQAVVAADQSESQEIMIAIQWFIYQEDNICKLNKSSKSVAKSYDLIFFGIRELLKSSLIYVQTDPFKCFYILQITASLSKVIFSFHLINKKRFMECDLQQELLEICDKLRQQMEIEKMIGFKIKWNSIYSQQKLLSKWSQQTGAKGKNFFTDAQKGSLVPQQK